MSLPPLVAPGAELTAEEVGRYSRHVLLPELGLTGQRRLKAARVAVVGAGGLGSPALLYLAAAGVGTLGVVDDDVVDTSNLQRQVVHATGDAGRSKVESAADAVRALNPHVRVVPHRERLTPRNAAEVLAGYDVVLDGTDTFTARYTVSDACRELGLPCVWGSVLRFDGQVSLFWSSPPADESGAVPPAVTYRDVFPVPPAPGLVPSCGESGVLGALCGAVGSVMATEAVKLVCGIGEPLLGRLLVLDGLAMTWRTVRVRTAASSPAGTPSGRPVQSREQIREQLPEPAPEEDEISATDLAALLARGSGADGVLLVDVREPQELDIVTIPGAVAVPMARFRSGEAATEIHRLRAGRPASRVVLYCKSGVRSAEALALLRASGVVAVAHLRGGVLAWIDDVAPDLPRY